MNLGQNKINDFGRPSIFSKLLYSPWSNYENGVLTITGSLQNPAVLEELESCHAVGTALMAFLDAGENGFDLDVEFFNPNMLRTLGYKLEKAGDGLFYFICTNPVDVIGKSDELIAGGKIFAGSFSLKYQRWLNDANKGYRARLDDEGFLTLKKKDISLKEHLSTMLSELKKGGAIELPIPFSKANSVRQQLWLLGIKGITMNGDDQKIIIRRRLSLTDEIESARIALRSDKECELSPDFSPTYVYQHLRRMKSDLDIKFRDGKYYLFHKEVKLISTDSICAYVDPVVKGEHEFGVIPLDDVSNAEKVRKVISRKYFRMISTKVMFGEEGHFLKIWKK